MIVEGPTWEEAEANAVALGGNLVSGDDEVENQWIKENLIPGFQTDQTIIPHIELIAPAPEIFSVNLFDVSSARENNSLLIDSDENDATLYVRLSEELSRTSKTKINLDATAPSNRDILLLTSEINDELTQLENIDSQTTWNDIGQEGIEVSNFQFGKDTIGVVGDNGDFVFNGFNSVLPVNNIYTDGRLFLNLNSVIDINGVSSVRDFVAANIGNIDRDAEIGFFLFDFDDHGSIDVGLFHVKWTGSDGADPLYSSPELHVKRLAFFSDVQPDDLLSLGSAIAARNLLADADHYLGLNEANLDLAHITKDDLLVDEFDFVAKIPLAPNNNPSGVQPSWVTSKLDRHEHRCISNRRCSITLKAGLQPMNTHGKFLIIMALLGLY